MCNNPTRRYLCEDECETCFQRSFSNVYVEKLGIYPADYWVKELNDGILPHQVTRSANKSFYFRCHKKECNHIFTRKLCDCAGRRGTWCPFCAGKKLCDDPKCKGCSKKSFEGCPKSEFWFQSMNGDVTPRNVMLNSHESYYFICYDCDHYYSRKLYDIVKTKTQGCPYCNGDELCGSFECKICHERSFASHPKSKFWLKSNMLKPNQVRKNSNKKFWFQCDECHHTFETKLDNIINGGTWCPFCSSSTKKLCDDNECQMCFEMSFASSKKAKYIIDVDPRFITKSSHKKYTFQCEECEFKFEMTLNNITNGRQWCPRCINKTELKFEKFLKETFPKKNIKRQVAFDWCKGPKTGKKYPFDFMMGKILIEIDGDQHFKQISNWTPPEEVQKRDRFKERRAIENGFSVIRLLQTDVLFDKNNWKVLFTKLVKNNQKRMVYHIYGGKITEK